MDGKCGMHEDIKSYISVEFKSRRWETTGEFQASTGTK